MAYFLIVLMSNKKNLDMNILKEFYFKAYFQSTVWGTLVPWMVLGEKRVHNQGFHWKYC